MTTTSEEQDQAALVQLIKRLAAKEVEEEVEFILIGAGWLLLQSWAQLIKAILEVPFYDGWFAGLPRTGTLSTWTALEQLLPGKCHHMLRAFSGPHDLQFWTRAAAGELSDSDWLEFIRTERLSAAVDFPMSLFWRDLVRLYPNAKVLYCAVLGGLGWAGLDWARPG